MEIKFFKGKEIKIRSLLPKDVRKAKKFQNFVNSLVEEKAPVTINEKVSLEEEKNWIKNNCESIKKKRKVFLVAEHKNSVVGIAHIDLHPGRESHIGRLGISIKRGYRRIGLGTYLTKKIIELAKKELNPPPKIIRLSVYSVNKPAIQFYKKLGFKKVAEIPRQAKFGDKLVGEIVMILEEKYF